MKALALLLGMGDETRRWGWSCSAYCLLTLLHTISALNIIQTAEDGLKEKQLAEDALKKAVKILEKPRNISSGGLLLSSNKNDIFPFVPPVVTAFYMWSTEYRKGKEYQKILPSNLDDVKKLHFTIQKTFIIIHGFLGNGLEEWIQSLKDKLISREDCNVISVDWPAGNQYWLPSYYTAVSRVPFVGMDTAALLDDLNSYKGLDISSVHLVGHSLGGHASGFCGKCTKTFLKKTIGRISGLDPAGLMFHETPSSSRLDKSDASYVDIIHTNGCYSYWAPWTDCFGINMNLGHTDFWPNGGEYQPACRKKSDNLNSNQRSQQSNNFTVEGEIGCDHEMAYVYFMESIDYSTDGTYFLARPCINWTRYADGLCSCGEYAQYMGYNSFNGLNGVFYLSTNKSSPFAISDGPCKSAWSHTRNIIIPLSFNKWKKMVNGIFYLSTNKTSPFAIRDASCDSAWSHTRYIIILLSSSTSAAVLALLLMGTAVYCMIKKCRRKEECQSGLVVETDDDSVDYDSGSACSI